MDRLEPQSFINEPIKAMGAAPTPAGLMTAPTGFTWRERTFQVIKIMELQKGLGRDRSHQSPERYLDRLWFKCQLENHQIATLYFDRRIKGPKPRWFIYSLE